MKKPQHEILIAMLTVALCLGLAAAQQKEPATGHKSHQIVVPADVKWGPTPESWIKGKPPAEFAGPRRSQWAIIQGDPSKPGSHYVLRIKSPDGEKVPPHWHPQDEHLTVLQGTFVLGMGQKFDQSAGRELGAGAFAVVPKNSWHFGWTKGETILQAHGIGPFVINFEKPEESGKKPSSSQ
jgi:quercetin dioxygenase-like cupin family protein